MTSRGQKIVTEEHALEICVLCGYAAANTPAFTDHDRELDFDLADPAAAGLTIRCIAGRYAVPADDAGNRLDVTADAADFELEIAGFDRHRRVDVRCDLH